MPNTKAGKTWWDAYLDALGFEIAGEQVFIKVDVMNLFFSLNPV